jgi:hypothetical protein
MAIFRQCEIVFPKIADNFSVLVPRTVASTLTTFTFTETVVGIRLVSAPARRHRRRTLLTAQYPYAAQEAYYHKNY